MNKSKHTPAPWSAHTPDISRPDLKYICGKTTGWGNDIVAEVETGGVPERESNLRVLVAAPTLVDLLERIVKSSSLNHLPDLKRECLSELAKINANVDVCVHCRRKFVQGDNMHTSAGWREITISGYCEECFDNLTDESRQAERPF